jgi:hypothetical protein
MLLYSTSISNRLRYVISFVGKELFPEPIEITTDAVQFQAYVGAKINYSEDPFSEAEFHIQPQGLLFETGVKPQQIECFELNFHKAFFPSKGDHPFDLFSAIFYLISRYEEYLPHEKDQYGRYAHYQSLAYKEGFLQQPLVNIWLTDFKKTLERKYPGLLFKHSTFQCLITYDIDIAYAYTKKSPLLKWGGYMKDLLKGNWAELEQRTQVLAGKEKDPYDCFEWLDALHLYCRIKPHYFFLVASKRGEYDKNTPTSNKALQELIGYASQQYKIGIHPSWQSGDDTTLLKEERDWLEVVADKEITHSRQHYIRFELPTTFRTLEEIGIEKEFSMGYGTINGFRASVASSYQWYDLEQERISDLVLYPYCFMDANAFYEQRYQPQQAYAELMQLYQQVKRHSGLFISIWHNHMLGSHPMFKGWAEMFELFMKETVYWDAYNY